MCECSVCCILRSCWTSPRATRRRRREDTWTWMHRGRGRQLLSRPPPDKSAISLLILILPHSLSSWLSPPLPLSFFFTPIYFSSLSFTLSLPHSSEAYSIDVFQYTLLCVCVCVCVCVGVFVLVDIFPAGHWTSGPSQTLSWRPSGEILFNPFPTEI